MFGFELRNSSNEVIIDSKLSNLEFVEEINIGITTAHPVTGYWGVYTFPVTYPTTPLVYCLQPVGSTIYGSFVTKSSVFFYVNTSGTYKVRVLLPVKYGLGLRKTKWGVEVYDSFGNMTWTSASSLIDQSTLLARLSSSLSITTTLNSAKGTDLWGTINGLGLMYATGSGPGVNEMLYKPSANSLQYKRGAPFGTSEITSYDGRPYIYYYMAGEEL